MNFLKEQSVYLLGLAFFASLALYGLYFLEKGSLVLFFSENRHTFLNYFFILGSSLAEGYVHVLAFLVYFFIRYDKALGVLFSAAFAAIFVSLLKGYFARPRPVPYFEELLGEGAIALVPDIYTNISLNSSFPSGHSTAAFALFGLLAFLNPQKTVKVLFLLLAVWVAISRLYLAQHFLEDISFGLFLGSFIAILAYFLIQYLQTFNWSQKAFKVKKNEIKC